MSYLGFIGEVTTVLIESSTTGLTDVSVVATTPAGVNIAAAATTEIGSSKVYKVDITPADEGTYVLKIVSPTDTQIDGRKTGLSVKPVSKFDMGGTGFDSSTDSLSVLSDKLDTITSNQASGENGFL